MSTFVKDPSAVLDYQWDWSEWLADEETISEAEVTVPEGLTLESYDHTDTAVTAWISGGTAGRTYAVTCRITTSAERIDERSIYIKLENR